MILDDLVAVLGFADERDVQAGGSVLVQLRAHAQRGPLGVGFLQHSFDRHGRPVRQLQHPADPSVRARAARTRTLGLKISFPR